jgi:predicted PurR-regulated permease PerM
VLNPIIYGKHLKLNPVFTLIILYVGYHAFGLWGMLLGVPVARYFIHHVLGVFREPKLHPRPAA